MDLEEWAFREQVGRNAVFARVDLPTDACRSASHMHVTFFASLHALGVWSAYLVGTTHGQDKGRCIISRYEHEA